MFAIVASGCSTKSPQPTPTSAAPASAPPARAGSDQPALVGESNAASPADAKLLARPDVSRLPIFVPAAAPPGQAWVDDDVDRPLDTYHQQRQDALEHALAAVVRQPDRATARYMLACALAVNGFHDDARVVLEALRAAHECASCRDALLNAPADAECDFGAAEVAVASGLTPSPVRAAALAVLTSLGSGDPKPALPYLDATRPAQFSFVGLECDPASGPACLNTKRYSRTALIALIQRTQQVDYKSPTRMFCDQECCGGPNPSHTHAPVVHVTQLCFRPGRPLLLSLDAGVDG